MRILLVMDDRTDLQAPAEGCVDLFESVTAEFEEDELLAALRDAGHEVRRLRGLRNLLGFASALGASCDLVLNCSDGLRGPDSAAWAASILDTAGIPYVGSPGLSLSLQRDKNLTKTVARTAGVKTPPSAILASEDDLIPDDLPFPAIVKPIGKGSSIGVMEGRSVVRNARDATHRAIELIRLYGEPALVETFVRGVEVEVPILVDPVVRALGVAAVTVQGRPLEGDAHLTSELVAALDYGYTEPPAGLDQARVRQQAEAVARALGVRDYGRVDFRVAADGTPWLIEANGHPSLQMHSSMMWLGLRRGLPHSYILNAVVSICAWRCGVQPVPQREPWTDL